MHFASSLVQSWEQDISQGRGKGPNQTYDVLLQNKKANS